jgi:hypothetical protein
LSVPQAQFFVPLHCAYTSSSASHLSKLKSGIRKATSHRSWSFSCASAGAEPPACGIFRVEAICQLVNRAACSRHKTYGFMRQEEEKLAHNNRIQELAGRHRGPIDTARVTMICVQVTDGSPSATHRIKICWRTAALQPN